MEKHVTLIDQKVSSSAVRLQIFDNSFAILFQYVDYRVNNQYLISKHLDKLSQKKLVKLIRLYGSNSYPP